MIDIDEDVHGLVINMWLAKKPNRKFHKEQSKNLLQDFIIYFKNILGDEPVVKFWFHGFGIAYPRWVSGKIRQNIDVSIKIFGNDITLIHTQTNLLNISNIVGNNRK